MPAPLDPLRRHVLQRPHEGVRKGSRVRDLPADPKVRDLDVPGGVQEDVLRLDVAVDEVEVLVEVLEAPDDAVGELGEEVLGYDFVFLEEVC